MSVVLDRFSSSRAKIESLLGAGDLHGDGGDHRPWERTLVTTPLPRKAEIAALVSQIEDIASMTRIAGVSGDCLLKVTHRTPSGSANEHFDAALLKSLAVNGFSLAVSVVGDDAVKSDASEYRRMEVIGINRDHETMMHLETGVSAVFRGDLEPEIEGLRPNLVVVTLDHRQRHPEVRLPSVFLGHLALRGIPLEVRVSPVGSLRPGRR